MTFLKNLFKKQPIVQETLNLGKIIATVYLKDGKTLEYKFEGEYSSSTDLTLFGKTTWFDFYTTANKEFSDWFAEISQNKFIKIDKNTFLPFSDIVRISTKTEDYFVETKRGE